MFSCYVCRQPSGTCLVCEKCRPRLTPYQQQVVTELWHDEICSRAYDSERNQFQCFHCVLWFDREFVCGDHWPDTKAAAPKKRYDVTAGVCCCAGCNTSGNRNRKTIKKVLCKKCRVRYPVINGVCVACV